MLVQRPNSRMDRYSLLGPSGCGKTTLLKCILGQHKIQVGSLKVYGRIPGSKGFPIPGRGVGYMPQELGLYLEMTIEEIMVFFGYLYGMKRQLINERMKFLVELLALPKKKRMIKHLSGGQQRRVSFAIALLHKPPLLILDEPTVGVDPVLRQTIWDHLVTLTRNERLTIIITTHYTEEARQASTVGLMRYGHLIVERNPEDLVKQHGVITLEEVFLKLCQKRNDEDDDDHERCHNLTTTECLNEKLLTGNDTVLKEMEASERHTEEKRFEKNGQDFMIPMDSESKYDGVFDGRNGLQGNTTVLLPSPSLPKEFCQTTAISALSSSLIRFRSLSGKNVLRLKRNIFMMVFSILIPTMQVIMFCVCLGSEPFGLHVAVVNMDEDLNRYGEKLLLTVDNRTIVQEKYDNLAAAYDSVKAGATWAALYIGPEFSPCLVDRVLEAGNASNDTIRCSIIKMYLDKSNHIIANRIYVTLMEAYQKFASHLLGKYERSSMLVEPPIGIEEYVYGSASTSIMEFIAPAIIVGIAYVIAMALTVMAILEEKQLGLFERTFVAGASAAEVLFSIFFVLLGVLFLQVILMIMCAFFVFNVPCIGPVFWVIVGVLMVGFGGMSYGLVISTVTDDVISGCIIAAASFFPTILLSGLIWPVEAMPYYVRYFSYCLPLTKMIDSMRALQARGWGVFDHNVWNGYVICNFWTLVFMILSLILLRVKK